MRSNMIHAASERYGGRHRALDQLANGDEVSSELPRSVVPRSPQNPLFATDEMLVSGS